MQLLQEIKEAFHSGDSEIRTWFLVQHNYLPLILCGFYALFSWVIGPALMKNRKPFDLRKPMIVFNFIIVAIYLISLTIIFWNLRKISREAFCVGGVKVRRGNIFYTGLPTLNFVGSALLQVFSWLDEAIALAKGLWANFLRLTTWCWVIYILKYAEFFDTVFFILRKKNNLITFLHVMHHTIVPILGWTMLRTESSGFQSIPVLLNACVHVVMYTYYGLAAMGPQVRKYLWWKKYLTQIQIFQFFMIIVFVTIITPITGCRMMKVSYLMDIILGPVFLYLFYTFYQQNYKSRKSI